MTGNDMGPLAWKVAVASSHLSIVLLQVGTLLRCCQGWRCRDGAAKRGWLAAAWLCCLAA